MHALTFAWLLVLQIAVSILTYALVISDSMRSDACGSLAEGTCDTGLVSAVFAVLPVGIGVLFLASLAVSAVFAVRRMPYWNVPGVAGIGVLLLGVVCFVLQRVALP